MSSPKTQLVFGIEQDTWAIRRVIDDAEHELTLIYPSLDEAELERIWDHLQLAARRGIHLSLCLGVLNASNRSQLRACQRIQELFGPNADIRAIQRIEQTRG